MAFAYLASHLLQVSPLQKQKFLTAPTGLELLTQLRAAYRFEVALLKSMWIRAQAAAEVSQELPFSLN